jgi:hypothetical protein
MLYAAGYTSWLFVPDTSYFPVFNPGGMAYFEEVYSGGTCDAFLLGFCKDLFTAVLEPSAAVDPATPLRVLSLGPDLWQLVGLPDGRHRIALFDAAGRVAARRDLNSLQGISEPFRLGALAPGLYIGGLDDDASRSFRFIHQP